MFEYATQIITPDGNYPVNICCSCLEELVISYKFKRKCEENHEVLTKLQMTKEVPVMQLPVSLEKPKLVPRVNGTLKEGEPEALEKIADRLSCNNCPAVFYTRADLRDHTLQEHLAEGLYRYCEVCQMTVVKTRFKQHLQQQHGIEDENLVCIECSLMYPTENELQKHKARVHDVKYIYRCRFCQLGYMTVGNLVAHVQKEHSCTPGFQCAHCNFTAYSKYAMRVHVTLHAKKTLFHCQICNNQKSFRTAIALRNHEISAHSVDKPFQCSKCFRMYKSSKALHAHKTVHNPSQYECPVCGKIFSFGHNLRQHARIVHPGFKLPAITTLLRDDLLPMLAGESNENGLDL